MDADNVVAAAAAAQEAATDPWTFHPLRKLLKEELLNYNIPLDPNDMSAREVWDKYFNQEDTTMVFDGMVFDQGFKTRLSNLRKQISASLSRAADDQLAYDIHRRNFPYEPFDAQGNRNWYGSAAEELLEEDLAQGLYPAMTPMELYATRAEYQEFSLTVFRGHIHQIIDTAKFIHTLKTIDAELQAKKQREREKRKAKIEKKAATQQAKAAKEAERAAKEKAKQDKALAKAAMEIEKAKKKTVREAAQADKVFQKALKDAEKANKRDVRAAAKAAKANAAAAKRDGRVAGNNRNST
jgi:septal ring factor EnvC (AmiA/AmiB activator)